MGITYLLREPFFAKYILSFMFLFFLVVVFVTHLLKNFNPYRSFIWFLYDFSGVRLIVEKIFPLDFKTKKEKPSSFFLWLIGIYIALFGIASNRYENSVDILETQTTGFFTQFSSSDDTSKKYLLRRIASIQNKAIPIKPDLFIPYTMIQSFFFSEKNQLIVDTMKGVVEDNKLKLKEAILDNADLRRSDLSEADLEGAIIKMANLSFASFEKANLSNAKIEKCDISFTNFKDANISAAELIGLDLDLVERNSITIQQLCTVKSLKGCSLNELQKKSIESQCPDIAATIGN